MDSTTTTTKATGTQTTQSTCSKHGEYTASVFTLFNGSKINTGCPKCSEETKAIKEREDKELRLLKFQEMFHAIVGLNVVPVRYREKKLDDYKPDNPNAEEIKKRCKNYVEKFDTLKSLGTSLILSGKPGTGKTHISCAIANELISKNNLVAYISVFTLITNIKATYRKDAQETEKKIISSLLKPHLLILDEVGVQLGTDFEKVVINHVINLRYENIKPTIIVSNLNIDELELYLGVRAIDRIYENHGTVFNFDWDSHRRKKQ